MAPRPREPHMNSSLFKSRHSRTMETTSDEALVTTWTALWKEKCIVQLMSRYCEVMGA